MIDFGWFVEKMRYIWPSAGKLEAAQPDKRVTGILISRKGAAEHVVNGDVRGAMDRLFDTQVGTRHFDPFTQRLATHATYFELVRKASVTRDNSVIVTPLEPVQDGVVQESDNG